MLTKKRQAAMVVAVGGPLVIAGVSAIDRWMSRQAAARTFNAVDTVPESQAALILGALVSSDGEPLQALEDRLWAGWRLWRAGRVAQIVVSGNDGSQGRDEVGPMSAWLHAHGVPEGVVIKDPGAFRTLDSVVRARHRLDLHHVVICTQADHLPRALYLARATGLHAVGFVADRRVYRARWRSRFYEWASRSVAVMDVCLRGSLANQRRRATAHRSMST